MQQVIFSLLLVIFLFTNANAVLSTDSFPALVIVYDDGHIQDLNKALPMHQKMNAPAVSSVNPDTLGNKDRLNRKHLHNLELFGWEIASHGMYHAHLGKNNVMNRPKAGNAIIELENAHLIEKRYRYILYDPKTKNKEIIEVEDTIFFNDKHYIQTKDPLLFKYTKEAYVILTKKSMQKEIDGSKEKLREMGFQVKSFVYPYNGHTEKSEDIVRKHYLFARTGQREGHNFPKAFINTPPMNCREINAACFEKNLITDNDLDELLHRTVQDHGLLVLYAHSGNKNFSAQRLEHILQTAKDIGLNITTFQDLSADSAFFCR